MYPYICRPSMIYYWTRLSSVCFICSVSSATSRSATNAWSRFISYNYWCYDAMVVVSVIASAPVSMSLVWSRKRGLAAATQSKGSWFISRGAVRSLAALHQSWRRNRYQRYYCQRRGSVGAATGCLRRLGDREVILSTEVGSRRRHLVEIACCSSVSW